MSYLYFQIHLESHERVLKLASIAKQWRLRRLTHRAEHVVNRCSWTLASGAMYFLLCTPGAPQSCIAILFFFFFFKYLSIYLAVLGLSFGMCVFAQLLSHVRLFVVPWIVACQASLSMEFARQEYWSGLLFPPSGNFPDPGIKPTLPALQADFL